MEMASAMAGDLVGIEAVVARVGCIVTGAVTEGEGNEKDISSDIDHNSLNVIMHGTWR
jgi:hypothetical protein